MAAKVELEGYRELTETCAIAPSPDAACLLITGDDALEWLHGQVTQDVRNMAVGDCRAACLCSATGQIEALLSIASLPGQVVVTTFAESVQILFDRAESSIFMEDVSLERASTNWKPFVIQGPQAEKALSDLGLVASTKAFELPNGSGIGLIGPNDTAMLWCTEDDALALQIKAIIPTASPEAWNAVRIERGEPLWGQDIDARTLPPELGQQFLDRHVSYTKGCYIGQEVLMRIFARGRTNRTWVALLCEQKVDSGDSVSSATRESAGRVTSTAISPEFGPIATAMLHKDSATSGSIVTIGSIKAEVREMPLRPASY